MLLLCPSFRAPLPCLIISTPPHSGKRRHAHGGGLNASSGVATPARQKRGLRGYVHCIKTMVLHSYHFALHVH